jgi:gentisate 1,2-dioxygenase
MRQKLAPLWPSTRTVLPPGIPARKTQPTCWAYDTIRPPLLKASELTTIEKAERRVLVLVNPGHGLEKMLANAGLRKGNAQELAVGPAIVRFNR